MVQEFYEDRSDRIIVSDSIVYDRSSRMVQVSKPLLTPEDVVAVEFARVLEGAGMTYSIVTDYIAILFGRARRSDDIDFILDELEENSFIALCRRAYRAGFTMWQASISNEESIRSVYREYLKQGYGIRFAYQDIVVPNVEIKLAKTSIHKYAVTNSLRVLLNNKHTLRISPLELQIAYKLKLGSDKNLGDAIFIYTLFRHVINKKELYRWCRCLGVDCGVLEK